MQLQDSTCSVAPATDRTLRKCVARGGAVSIQDAPCAAGSKTAWARATTPDHLDDATRRRLDDDARRRDQDARYLSRLAGTDRPGNRGYGNRGYGNDRNHYRNPRQPRHRPSACETARRHRESVLEWVGLRRTSDLLRVLNDRVYEACQ